jgi:hypothetical protein
MRKPVGKNSNNKETKWELPAVVVIVRSIIGWKLLSDAELTEDIPQYLVRGDLAGDLP